MKPHAKSQRLLTDLSPRLTDNKALSGSSSVYIFRSILLSKEGRNVTGDE
jgi:hypothetical protein